MGVSYYACKSCGESRYEEFVGDCTGCGSSLCTACLVNDDIGSDYASDYGAIFDGSKEMMEKYDISQEAVDNGWVEIDGVIDDTAIHPKYCPFCEGYEINEGEFVAFLINRTGLSRNELEDEFRKSK